MIPQGEYRRQCFVSGVLIFLVAGGIFWGVIKTWREKDEKDKLEKSWASSKAGNFGLSFDSWNTLMDVIKEIELKNDITLTDRIKSGIAKFKQQYPGEKFDEAGVAEFLTGDL